MPFKKAYFPREIALQSWAVALTYNIAETYCKPSSETFSCLVAIEKTYEGLQAK